MPEIGNDSCRLRGRCFIFNAGLSVVPAETCRLPEVKREKVNSGYR